MKLNRQNRLSVAEARNDRFALLFVESPLIKPCIVALDETDVPQHWLLEAILDAIGRLIPIFVVVLDPEVGATSI